MGLLKIAAVQIFMNPQELEIRVGQGRRENNEQTFEEMKWWFEIRHTPPHGTSRQIMFGHPILNMTAEDVTKYLKEMLGNFREVVLGEISRGDFPETIFLMSAAHPRLDAFTERVLDRITRDLLQKGETQTSDYIPMYG